MRGRSLLLLFGPTTIVVIITALGIWAPSGVLFAGYELAFQPRIALSPSAVVVSVPEIPETPKAANDPEPSEAVVGSVSSNEPDLEGSALPGGAPVTTDEPAGQDAAVEQAQVPKTPPSAVTLGLGPSAKQEVAAPDSSAVSNTSRLEPAAATSEAPDSAPLPQEPSNLAGQSAAQEADVVAAVPDAADDTPGSEGVAGAPPASGAAEASQAQGEDAVAALPATDATQMTAPPKPATPERLFIADAIRLKLEDPEIIEEADPADLEAVEAYYGDHAGPALWVTGTGLSPAAKTIIEEISEAERWGLDSGDFVLPGPDAQASTADEQAALEVGISLAILKYARAARGGLVEPSALSKVYNLKPLLPEPSAVLAKIVASDTPGADLRDLHPKQEQFEKLRQALLKAQPEEIPRLKANMDRWRWMPEDLGTLYVWINVPEYMLHVVKEGAIIVSEKIAVGGPASPTPVFSADLRSIVFHPERIVPHSVIRQDVLPALQKKGNWFGKSDTSVLERYQLTVKRNGKPVDPDKIDWEKVNLASLTFVQAPGPTNILGKVQFLYPNALGVYLHDTVLPQQLNREVRAVGQREPRVANPAQLAALLLAEDKAWPKAKVDKLIADGKTAEVDIQNPIPVHTTYFTAVVAEDGEVRTFADVYSLDDSTAAMVAERSEPTSDAAPMPARKPKGVAASRP